MKHVKLIAMSALILIGLVACNNNNEAQDLRNNRMTTLGDNGTDYLDTGTDQRARTGKEIIDRTGEGNGTTGILQTPDGYLTVDPNSYSTGLPSSEYPHTGIDNQGTLTFEDRERLEGPNFQFPPLTPTEGATPEPRQGAGANQSGTELSAFESRVIDLTNDHRRKNGLPNLQPDTALSNVAQEKSNDMQAKNYFSHTSPTYGSPFDMMRDFGVTYRSAGENIAMGQQNAEEVVNAWMNSEGHRKNILSPNFTHIGVGHTGSGNYWTQMFIGK